MCFSELKVLINSFFASLINNLSVSINVELLVANKNWD